MLYGMDDRVPPSIPLDVIRLMHRKATGNNPGQFGRKIMRASPPGGYDKHLVSFLEGLLDQGNISS